VLAVAMLVREAEAEAVALLARVLLSAVVAVL
jgi:hypothetical protein